MADVKEKDLSAKSSLTGSDYLRVTGSDNVSYKQLVSDVAKYIVENYTGSSVAGSAQSIKSALDALNSKSYRLISERALLEYVPSLPKGTYHFRCDTFSDAPAAGGLIYTITKTGDYNLQCVAVAIKMDAANPIMYTAFINNGSTSINWVH